MSKHGTITVICPDKVERRAQITSVIHEAKKLSVRLGGRRVAGFLGEKNLFIPTGKGKNGNPFRFFVTK